MVSDSHWCMPGGCDWSIIPITIIIPITSITVVTWSQKDRSALVQSQTDEPFFDGDYGDGGVLDQLRFQGLLALQ